MSIAGLDATKPSSDSNAGLGDDEIRALKAALKASFGGVAGPVLYGAGNPLVTHTQLTAIFDRLDALESSTAGIDGLKFQPGMIVIWNRDLGTVPGGWAICDGNTVNGVVTPDLTDGRFVRNPGDGHAWGAVGGASSETTSSVNSNAGATAGTALTMANMPSDLLTALQVNIDTGGDGIRHDSIISAAGGQSGNAGTPRTILKAPGGVGGSAHTHSISGSAHTHVVDTVPLFASYYYICYVGTP